MIFILHQFIILLFFKCALSSLSVFSPSELSSKFLNKEIQTNFAYFGYIPWDKTIIGTVYYLGDGCFHSNTKEFDNNGFPIVLVDSLNCSFLTKAKFAQLLGAKLIVISDEDYKDNEIFNENKEEIHIPVVIIRKHNGEILKEYLTNDKINRTVTISITFERRKIDKVDIILWLSTSDIKSYNYLANFYKTFQSIINDVEITPLYALWFCTYCKYNDFNIINDNCLSGGRYCYPDPDSNGPLLGKTYVKESLRQICIHKTDNIKWWNYIEIYSNNCIQKLNLEECSQKTLQELNFNVNKVNLCVKESFLGINEDLDDNLILSNDHKKFKQDGIQSWPTIVINNEILKEEINLQTTFLKVCQAFTSPPQPCLELLNIITEKKKPEIEEKNKEISTNNFQKDLFLLIGSLLIFFVLALICFCWAIRSKIFTKVNLSRDISLNISTVVSNYFAFKDKADSERIVEINA